MINSFSEVQGNKVFWTALGDWWESLQKDRGARAELRRAKSPTEVFTSRAFWRVLVPTLRRANFDLSTPLLERLALPVGILAHARRPSSEKTFPRQLAAIPKASEEIRDARFRRLITIRDGDRDELYRMLLRLVRMLDGTVDPVSLTIGTVWWNETTRRAWAEQYYLHAITN